jgi:hypothetical protein
MRHGPRYRDAVIPLILIVAGAVALLINTHVLSQQAIDNLVLLWPLILIVAGAQLVMRVLLPARTATIGALALAVIAIVGALAVAIAGPPIVPSGTTIVDSSAALGEAGVATASVEFGGATVTIHGQDLGTQAYRARIEYPAAQGAPRIVFLKSGNILNIKTGAGLRFALFESGSSSVDLTLSTHVAWVISVGGGAGDVNLNLSNLRLRNLSIGGGASNVTATLGPPTDGTDTVQVSGGASDVTLHLAQGSQWRIQVSGGASSVQVDGQDLGDSSGSISRASSGYATATNRYDIQVSGGASNVVLDTRGG